MALFPAGSFSTVRDRHSAFSFHLWSCQSKAADGTLKIGHSTVEMLGVWRVMHRSVWLRPRIHEQKNSKVYNESIRYVKQAEVLTHAIYVNGWLLTVYMSYISQNICFHVSKLFVLNFLFFGSCRNQHIGLAPIQGCSGATYSTGCTTRQT